MTTFSTIFWHILAKSVKPLLSTNSRCQLKFATFTDSTFKKMFQLWNLFNFPRIHNFAQWINVYKTSSHQNCTKKKNLSLFLIHISNISLSNAHLTQYCNFFLSYRLVEEEKFINFKGAIFSIIGVHIVSANNNISVVLFCSHWNLSWINWNSSSIMVGQESLSTIWSNEVEHNVHSLICPDGQPSSGTPPTIC